MKWARVRKVPKVLHTSGVIPQEAQQEAHAARLAYLAYESYAYGRFYSDQFKSRCRREKSAICSLLLFLEMSRKRPGGQLSIEAAFAAVKATLDRRKTPVIDFSGSDCSQRSVWDRQRRAKQCFTAQLHLQRGHTFLWCRSFHRPSSCKRWWRFQLHWHRQLVRPRTQVLDNRPPNSSAWP